MVCDVGRTIDRCRQGSSFAVMAKGVFLYREDSRYEDRPWAVYQFPEPYRARAPDGRRLGRVHGAGEGRPQRLSRGC
jgi:hypothetical protein